MGSQDRPYMDPAQRRGGEKGKSCSSGAGCGCRGKDLGPVEDFEEPSDADLEQFGSATRRCSQCSTEVYDDAEVCHSCGHAFNQADDGRFLPTWAVATTFGVIGLFALGLIFYVI
jgi:hypothetical protein